MVGSAMPGIKSNRGSAKKARAGKRGKELDRAIYHKERGLVERTEKKSGKKNGQSSPSPAKVAASEGGEGVPRRHRKDKKSKRKEPEIQE